ncbi:YidB family protein [Polaromonas sp.]|uniref:YidB family protein n=1 Tax=Polaromonas sp. TaxID=1869339 RepID=UPI00286D53F8|nr:YidB family protein [Polaromonas sp.]
MGLLDSVLGAVMGGQQPQDGANAMGGGLGGLLSMVTSNPQLLQAITGMLSNEGAQGGLGGLVAKFQQAGLGDVIGSWVGSGQNQAISGDQLTEVLGSDAMSGLAAKLGLSQGEAAGQLSSILPGIIDRFTPQGQAPAAGLGDSGELMGMLDGLLQKS